jgi:hypothetical protein
MSDKINATDVFKPFAKKLSKKDPAQKLSKLKEFRKNRKIQILAKAVLDFSMNDTARFDFLFHNKEENLKLIWQFIYLSFYDQDLMMLELRYKKYAEVFTRINDFQLQCGLIAKKDVQIVYRLFKLFCLKVRVFSAFIKRPK